MQHIQEISRQHSYAAPAPPMNSQQNFSRPPIIGQQNLTDSQIHSPQSLLSPVQSMNHSQITNPPTTGVLSSQLSSPLPMGPHGHGQSSTDYQTQMANPPNTSLSQSGIGLYNSMPPLQAVSLTSSINPTGLSQFESRQLAHPQFALSTMGQLANPPGTSLPQVRQKQYLQTGPPILGQTVTNPVGVGVLQSGQRQYSSTVPPLPGQTLSSPSTMNRTSSSTTSYQQPTYQQPGYHNQMVL